jgi:hypothetical protein
MDPLRPFLSLVRSLWTSGAAATSANRAQSAVPPHSTSHAAALAPSQPIERRLHSHLTALGAWNAQRAREVFVKQVLLSELGEELATDPAFADLIERVSGQLGGDPRLSARLDDLLRQIATSH